MGEITAELVLERIRAAGGTLVLKGLSAEERAEWRRAAKVAYLRLHRVGREQLSIWSKDEEIHIRLLQDRVAIANDDDADWSHPPPVLPRTAEFRGRKVPVPSKLTKPHPLVERLVEASDVDGRFERRRGYAAPGRRRPAQRMRRIWQAIIVEAEFRGYRASLEHSRRDIYDTGQLVISIGRDDIPLVLSGGGQQPLSIRLEIEGVRRNKRETWTDSADAQLESQLGALMTRVEELAQVQVDLREVEYQRVLERRRRWDEAAVIARRVFVEDFFRAALATRVAAGREAREMRAYADAIERRAAGLADEDRAQAFEWAAWIQGHADEIDPARMSTGVPSVPEPTDRDLRPYLERAGLSGWRP